MPSDEKHTPGPWEIIPQHGAGPIIAHPYETGQQMNPKGLRLVCHVLARGNSLQQDEANARLIASAPSMQAEIDRLRALNGEMRAALEGAVAAWDRLYGNLRRDVTPPTAEDDEFNAMQNARALAKQE